MHLYLWPGIEMIAGFHDNRHRSFRPSTVEGVEYQVSSQDNLLVSPSLHHLVEEDSSHGRDIIWLLGDRVEQGGSLDISWVLTIDHPLPCGELASHLLYHDPQLGGLNCILFWLRCCWFVHNLQTQLLPSLCLSAV
jgi:hypothetical protein